MSIFSSNNNLAYGLNNPLQKLAPRQIFAQRAPEVTDLGQLGQQWIFNNQIWQYTSSQLWNQIITALTPVGSLTINGPLTVNSGGAPIVINSNGGTIQIGVESFADTINIGNYTAGTSVITEAGSNGYIVMDTNGSGNIVACPNDVDVTGTTTATNKSIMGYVAYTGLTLATTATMALVVNNDILGAMIPCGVLATVTNNNISGNNALLTVQGVTQTTTYLQFNIINNGTGALALTDTLYVSYWLLIPNPDL